MLTKEKVVVDAAVLLRLLDDGSKKEPGVAKDEIDILSPGLGRPQAARYHTGPEYGKLAAP